MLLLFSFTGVNHRVLSFIVLDRPEAVELLRSVYRLNIVTANLI